MQKPERSAQIERVTGETRIHLSFHLDGTGRAKVTTGVGFFDHMLTLFARHGLFDLEVQAEGDLHIDAHHTIEDVGIVLGQAIKTACGDKKGITRYGYFILPMDEALVLCALDLSGRPYLGYDLQLRTPKLGDMETELVEEFFRAVSWSAGMNLHLRQLAGTNTHHVIESAFKAFGRALDMATRLDPRVEGVPSTKGVL
jgi:imidazoleglycerol-phosphate dehydratase